MKLTTTQLRFLRDLANGSELNRPWGYATAGRDAAAWDRTVSKLEELGLVTCSRPGAWQSVPTSTGGHRMVWVTYLYLKPRSAKLTLPAPAFVYAKE